jgi:hypothetical protein
MAVERVEQRFKDITAAIEQDLDVEGYGYSRSQRAGRPVPARGSAGGGSRRE